MVAAAVAPWMCFPNSVVVSGTVEAAQFLCHVVLTGCIDTSCVNSRLLAKYPSADGASGGWRMEGKQVVLTARICCSKHGGVSWQCLATVLQCAHTMSSRPHGVWTHFVVLMYAEPPLQVHVLLCSLSSPGTLSCAVVCGD
jgi:hypothetical protein